MSCFFSESSDNQFDFQLFEKKCIGPIFIKRTPLPVREMVDHKRKSFNFDVINISVPWI